MLCHITYEEQLTMYCKIFDVTKGRTETIFTMLEQVDAHAGTLCSSARLANVVTGNEYIEN